MGRDGGKTVGGWKRGSNWVIREAIARMAETEEGVWFEGNSAANRQMWKKIPWSGEELRLHNL